MISVNEGEGYKYLQVLVFSIYVFIGNDQQTSKILVRKFSNLDTDCDFEKTEFEIQPKSEVGLSGVVRVYWRWIPPVWEFLRNFQGNSENFREISR